MKQWREECIMRKELNRELLHSLFRLKSALNTEFVKDTSSAVKDINLPEYILMREIEENGSDLTAIREYLSITKSAVSQMLRSLEKKGYLTRRINLRNRRNIVVELTELGRTALQEKSAEFNLRYECVTNNMREGDIKQIINLINRLQCALNYGTAAPGL